MNVDSRPRRSKANCYCLANASSASGDEGGPAPQGEELIYVHVRLLDIRSVVLRSGLLGFCVVRLQVAHAIDKILGPSGYRSKVTAFGGVADEITADPDGNRPGG